MTPARSCRKARVVAGVVVALQLLAACAATAGPRFAGEDHDWGVAPAPTLRRTDYHAPTPREIPGARVIFTTELKSLLDREPGAVLVDVLGDPPHPTVPGSYWLRHAGLAEFPGDELARLETTLKKLAGGDRHRPLVFFCLSSECWLSYNAALRAVAFGFRDVMWYRGGVEAWREAGYATALSTPYDW